MEQNCQWLYTPLLKQWMHNTWRLCLKKLTIMLGKSFVSFNLFLTHVSRGPRPGKDQLSPGCEEQHYGQFMNFKTSNCFTRIAGSRQTGHRLQHDAPDISVCWPALFGLSQPTSGQGGSEVCFGTCFLLFVFWKTGFHTSFPSFLLTNGETIKKNLRTRMSIFGGDV